MLIHVDAYKINPCSKGSYVIMVILQYLPTWTQILFPSPFPCVNSPELYPLYPDADPSILPVFIEWDCNFLHPLINICFLHQWKAKKCCSFDCFDYLELVGWSWEWSELHTGFKSNLSKLIAVWAITVVVSICKLSHYISHTLWLCIQAWVSVLWMEGHAKCQGRAVRLVCPCYNGHGLPSGGVHLVTIQEYDDLIKCIAWHLVTK